MDLTAGHVLPLPPSYMQNANASEAGVASNRDATTAVYSRAQHDSALRMETALSENRFLKDRLKLLLSATNASTPALTPWLQRHHDVERKDQDPMQQGLNSQGEIERVLNENQFLHDQVQLLLIEEQWVNGKLSQQIYSAASPERQPPSTRAPVPPTQPEVRSEPEKPTEMPLKPVRWTVITDTDGDTKRRDKDPTSLFAARGAVRRSPQTASKNSSIPLLLPSTDIPPGLYGSIPLFKTSISEQTAYANSTEVHVKIFSMNSFDEKQRISGGSEIEDPFIKITIGKTSYRTRIKHNPGTECLEVAGVHSNVYSFQRQIDEKMLEVLLYDKHGGLAEGSIDLSEQTYSEVEHLRALRHGVPFSLVSNKTGKLYIVYLAFGASVEKADVTHVQESQKDSQDEKRRRDEVSELKKLLEREHELRVMQQIEHEQIRKVEADVIALQTQLLEARANKKLHGDPSVLSPSANGASVGLELGTPVMVHSLQSMPEYNGQIGRINMFLENDRAGVILDTDPEAMHSFHISKLIAIKHLAQGQSDGKHAISRPTLHIGQPGASLSPRTTPPLHLLGGQQGLHLQSDRSPQTAQVVPLRRPAIAVDAGNVTGSSGDSLLIPMQIETMGVRRPAVGEERRRLSSLYRHSGVQTQDQEQEKSDLMDTHSALGNPTQIPQIAQVPDLQVGAQVCVHSMSAAPEYNGQIGRVVQLLDTGRVGVRLKNDPDSMVIFKPSKLVQLTGEETSVQSSMLGTPQSTSRPSTHRHLHPSMSPSLSPPPVPVPGSYAHRLASPAPPPADVRKAQSVKPETTAVQPVKPEKGPEAAIQVHVRVFGISGFKATAGWMDKTDPYVKLILGKVECKTAVKNNAGGTVTFDETFSFTLQAKNRNANLGSSDVYSLLEDRGDSTLQVLVYDSDTLSDDLLGQREINLSEHPSHESVEALESLSQGMPFAMVDGKTGREQGTVHLAFAARSMHNTGAEMAQSPVGKEDKAPEHAVYSEQQAPLPTPEKHRDSVRGKESFHGTPVVLADAVHALNRSPQVVIELGSRVCVHSLPPDWTHLNGQVGTVTELLKGCRLGVVLDGKPNAMMSLKPENAALVQPVVQSEESSGEADGIARGPATKQDGESGVWGLGLEDLPLGYAMTGLKFWSSPTKALMIAGFVQGTSAERTGLVVGDTIVRVDGESVLHMEPHAILRRIAGFYGTEVALETKLGRVALVERDLNLPPSL